VRGIDARDLKDEMFCEICQIAKQARKPYPTVDEKRPYKPGEMTHGDLAGPMPTRSLGGALYFLLLKDNATGFCMACFLKEKSETAQAIMEYISFIECHTGNMMKIFKSDNGREFVNEKLAHYFAKKGIIHETSAAYCPQSNGKIEREIRTIKDTARAMLTKANVTEALWGEAVAASVYVHNRFLDKQSGKLTAYEQIFGRKPYVGHLKTFGCDAYAHVPDHKRSVWQPKAQKCMLVGYSGDSAKYRLYDPESRKVFEARNVSFYEEENTVKLTFETGDTKVEKKKKHTWSESSSSSDELDSLVDKSLKIAEEETEQEQPDNEPTGSPIQGHQTVVIFFRLVL